jgi:hypothetical protein
MPGVLVAVTDHAAERFGQRVAGSLDARLEVAGRVSDTLDGERGASASIYVHDLRDRDLVFVCRHDPRARELIVITMWERERLGPAQVPRRFTDALTARRPRR